jgi:hypothetical protein
VLIFSKEQVNSVLWLLFMWIRGDEQIITGVLLEIVFSEATRKASH